MGKEDATAQSLRLLAVGVAYIEGDYATAMATIRSVCALQPYSIVFW
jgi:hypothetical protein